MTFPFFEEQKKLLKDPDFFLTFEEFTEPIPNGIIEKEAKNIEHPHDAVSIITSNFRKQKVDASFIWTVKTMEKYKIAGGCSEYGLLAAALLRKAGIPTALIETIHIDWLYTFPHDKPTDIYPTPRSMHTLNLVYWKGKWFLFDVRAAIFTRQITLTLLKWGLFPLIIHRGYSDIGVKNRKEKFKLLFRRVKQVLPLLLEEDLLFPKHQLYLMEDHDGI